jgi:protein-tyrosine phosphatase
VNDDFWGWSGIGSGSVRPGRPRADAILPALLVGEYPNPRDVPWLAGEHGVTAILSLQDDADLASKRLTLREVVDSCAATGVVFERIPVPDGDPDFLADRLPAAVGCLREHIAAGKRVYLHCNAGLNRAPTVAIAYVHVHEGLSLDDATRFVKSRRVAVPYVAALERVYGPLRAP